MEPRWKHTKGKTKVLEEKPVPMPPCPPQIPHQNGPLLQKLTVTEITRSDIRDVLTVLHRYLNHKELGRLISRRHQTKTFSAVAIFLISVPIRCSHKICMIWKADFIKFNRKCFVFGEILH
jgi:hypothetical protein